MLPTADMNHLADRVPGSTVVADAGMIAVILPGFDLGSGLSSRKADLMLRLSPGYPDVAPDMWWFDPPVTRQDGRVIPATEVREVHFGRNWQRWSRHLTPGQWRSGIDSLESYLAIVRRELANVSSGVAA